MIRRWVIRRWVNRRWRACIAIAPVGLLIILYFPVLRIWFQLDDFAWLCLRNTLTHGRSIWWALFSPQAEGTIRPLGERLYFLALPGIFGLNPVPFRVAALVTASACVALLTYLAEDFGASAFGRRWWTGALAGLLWACNPALARPMVWASAWNQIAYTCFFLAGIAAMVRYSRTGRTLYLVLIWVALGFGLGANEGALMLAPVCILYSLLFDRSRLRNTLALGAVALAYLAIHSIVAPVPHTGPYRISASPVDLFRTLWQYWLATLSLRAFGAIRIIPAWQNAVAGAIVAALIFAGLLPRARKHDYGPLFWFGVYLLTLAPVLGFSSHIIDYYVFLPTAALAIMIASLAPGPGLRGWLFSASACLYVYMAVTSSAFVRDWYADRAAKVRQGGESVLAAAGSFRKAHAAARLYVSGVDNEQFWYAFCYGALQQSGVANVFLDKSAEKSVAEPLPEWCAMDYHSPAQADAAGNYLYDARGGLVTAYQPSVLGWISAAK